jgi:hypothetical protein
MDFAKTRELFYQASHDVGVLKSAGELPGWIIRFSLRLRDEAVYRAVLEDMKKVPGITHVEFTKTYLYELVRRLERDFHSIERSITRLQRMKKIPPSGLPELREWSDRLDGRFA